MTYTDVPSIVHHIVGRCHVGESHRHVIRFFVSRLKHGYTTWRGLSRLERKQYLAWIVEAHNANRALYSAVMRGRF